MLFNSFRFLLFFPITLILFHLLPRKAKGIWLLVCSYFFYLSWNPRYVVLILFSTVLTYACALGIQAVRRKTGEPTGRGERLVLAAGIVLNLSVLFLFKYFRFACASAIAVLDALGFAAEMPAWDPVLPVGISFYTFQTIGYMIDVYRGKVAAEKNFLQYALFVSFFPQLVAGPIERSENLMSQLKELPRPSYETVRHGLLVMLWGYFMKMVIADRAAIYVNAVYGSPEKFPGAYIVLATVLFAFQIYCDFAGYSTIALGAAETLGIRLVKNFEEPYLSTSIREFWKRWHVTLNTWFVDYVYIPLGGSRKGRLMKYRNIMIVFLLSGLWHGARWSFVLWGGLNGLFQILEDLLSGAFKKFKKGADSFASRLAKTLGTFLLIDFTWLFFRANGIRHAVTLLSSILTTHNPWILFDGTAAGGILSEKEFAVLLLSLGILLAAGLCARHGIRLSERIEKEPTAFRWIVYIGAILGILIFGVWGSVYNASNFIYFQF
ncbi:MAG: MBOAT family protein [Clostridiales bacterium]|nr:MBOAT family protein [Clostridiales bacterium]